MNQELYDLFLARERKISEGKTFLDARTGEDGKVSAADASAFSSITNEVDRMTNEINNRMNQPTSQPIYTQPGSSNPFTTNTETRAHRGAQPAIEGSYRAEFLSALRTNFRQISDVLQEGVDTSGGYLVPAEWDESIVTGLTEENVIRKLSRLIQTSGAHNIPVQTAAPAAAWIDEGAEIPLTSATFKQVTLGAHKIGTAIEVTNELLADAAYNVENYLQGEFLKCVGAAEEDAFLNGAESDTGKPTGILVTMGKSSGTTISTAGTSISADDLISLIHSVKRPYRKNAVFLMNDSTLAAVRKLKDSNQAYMWQPALMQGEPDRLLGVPCYTSAFMPENASGQIAILYGDFSAGVTVAQRGTTTIRALYETKALRDVSVFIMLERVDCALVDVNAIRGLRVK